MANNPIRKEPNDQEPLPPGMQQARAEREMAEPSLVERLQSEATDFERDAQGSPPGLLAEFWDFLVHNKKWWLAPIVILILLAGLLVILAGSVGPFIYPGL